MNHFRNILNLDSEQINEFFNILTQEGEVEVNFDDIESLITHIAQKRKNSVEEHPVKWI